MAKTLQCFPPSLPRRLRCPFKFYIHTWQKTNCAYSLAFSHHLLEIMYIHTHARTPLVSLAHVFHLILPFLCLLTSLYSQLSIGTIPANYPQCHSHYFPISTANLLHTFRSPPLPSTPQQDPSAPRQLLANFSSPSAKEDKDKNTGGEGESQGH